MRLDRARGDDSPWTRARDARDDDDDDDDDGDDGDDEDDDDEFLRELSRSRCGRHAWSAKISYLQEVH